MRIPIAQIRRDGGTFARKCLHQVTINEYARAMQQGTPFPAVVVFYDGKDYWLADGFHRVEAAVSIGFEQIEVDLKLGTQREAILYAVGANGTHGLKRTPADKRLGVTKLLLDEEWGKWSDRAIASSTATSHTFVAKVRKEVTGNVSSERVYVNKYGQTAKMKVSRIGTSRDVGQEVPVRVTTRWLGLDPSLASLGWAVVEADEDYDVQLVDYGTIETSKKKAVSERLWELEQDLVLLIQEFQPSGIALEMPILNNTYPNTTGVVKAIGVIELVCYRELGLVPVHFYPVQWKGHLGNGRADDEEVNETLSLLFDLSVSASLRLDAIGIAYAGCCGVGESA